MSATISAGPRIFGGMGISETRWRGEFLRIISYLVDYVHKMNVISFAMIAGIFLVVISPLFLLTGLIDLTRAFVIFYIGIFVVTYSYVFLMRERRRFYKNLRGIFESTLIKSRDYEVFEKNLRSKIKTLLNRVAEKEHALILRERDLKEMEARISKLRNQMEHERRELYLKRKGILRRKIRR